MSDAEAISFKHFSLFRRAVATKRTGVLVYITRLGFAGRITFIEGQLASAVDSVQLKHFFTKAMQQSHWEEQSGKSEPAQDAAVVLGSLLEPLEWNEVFSHALSQMLCKLPVVEVKAMPVQFEDYHLEICARLLCRQAVASDVFTPKQFLDGISNNHTLTGRLKVMVLAYVCGFMNAKKQNTAQTTVSKTASPSASSLAGRIFQRIKGIGL